MKSVESGGPVHELCFEKSCGEKGRGWSARAFPGSPSYLSGAQLRVTSQFYFHHSSCQELK